MENASYLNEESLKAIEDFKQTNNNKLDEERKSEISFNDVNISHSSRNIRSVSFSAIAMNPTNNEDLSKINDKEWSTYNKKEKISYIIFAIIKIILFIILLYLFLLSLNFMTIGFTMVAGYAIKAGPVIKFILSNPFAALAIGIIATAIMQNATLIYIYIIFEFINLNLINYNIYIEPQHQLQLVWLVQVLYQMYNQQYQL